MKMVKYYGLKKRAKKIGLYNDFIIKIRLHNKTMSIIYGIGVGHVTILGVGILL